MGRCPSITSGSARARKPTTCEYTERPAHVRDGKVVVMRSNLSWRPDGFDLSYRNGESTFSDGRRLRMLTVPPGVPGDGGREIPVGLAGAHAN